MTSRVFPTRAVQLVLVGAAVAMAAVAVAQESKEDTAEVRIEAERTVERVGRSTIGAPIELIQLTRRVSYADLDLGTHSGATELEQRIKDTAKAACQDLDKMYPMATDTGSCVNNAVKDAMVQANAAINAAEKRMRSAEAPPGE